MKRPSIKSPCVADRHHAPYERIAEVTFPNGKGCLLSLRQMSGAESAIVDFYRVDEGVRVRGPTTGDVHVLTYSHRHGLDVSVYATRELAEESASMIIRDWIEVQEPGTRKRIAKLLDAGRYADALELYEDATDESINIQELPVHS